MEVRDVSPGYDARQFKDLVDRELKASLVTDKKLVGDEEFEYLNRNIDAWKAELISLKKQTEKQFTSSKARSFKLYKLVHSGEITYTEYLKGLYNEKVWRVNSATFLQRIEARLQALKLTQNE